MFNQVIVLFIFVLFICWILCYSGCAGDGGAEAGDFTDRECTKASKQDEVWA